jgi:outer membrane protein assembly factor BamB
MMFMGVGQKVTALDWATQTLLWECRREGRVNSVTLAQPHGDTLFVAGGDFMVAEIHATTGHVLWNTKLGGHQTSVSCSPCGQFIVTGGGDSTATRLDVASFGGNHQRVHDLNRTKHPDGSINDMGCALHPDGATFVAYETGYVTKLDVATGQEMWKVQLQQAQTLACAFSPCSLLHSMITTLPSSTMKPERWFYKWTWVHISAQSHFFQITSSSLSPQMIAAETY